MPAKDVSAEAIKAFDKKVEEKQLAMKDAEFTDNPKGKRHTYIAKLACCIRLHHMCAAEGET